LAPRAGEEEGEGRRQEKENTMIAILLALALAQPVSTTRLTAEVCQQLDTTLDTRPSDPGIAAASGGTSPCSSDDRRACESGCYSNRPAGGSYLVLACSMGDKECTYNVNTGLWHCTQTRYCDCSWIGGKAMLGYR